MDFREILKMGLAEYMEDLVDALEGLSSEERRFQPTPESHHVDFVVWHMARVEDGLVNRVIRRGQQIWERDGWAEKLGLPERDSGFGFSAEQVANLPQFDFDGLMEYYKSVRTEVFQYIDGLTSENLEVRPSPERRPDETVGKVLSHLLVEEAEHVGQVAYLRGIQRGLNK